MANGYLLLKCPNCDNWGELPDDEQRHDAQGFIFNDEYNDGATFMCIACGTKEIKGEYIKEHDNDGWVHSDDEPVI
jgi:hypothetical protein